MSSIISSQELPKPGRKFFACFPAAKQLPCWIYRPKEVKRSDQVIVAIHGISRNSEQQVRAYRKLADEHGLWLIAPEFSHSAFPNYQRLVGNSKDARADLSLNRLLLAFRQVLGISQLSIHLCGYSGGAQFAHRYALLYPHFISSLTLVSAGWYSLINPNLPYPIGLKNWPTWLGSPRTKDFLSLPTLVLVGNQDTSRDKSLRQNPLLDKEQGVNRLERAQRWVKTTNQAKQALGLSQEIKLNLLDQQQHDFLKNTKQSDMLDQISTFWHQTKGNNQ